MTKIKSLAQSYLFDGNSPAWEGMLRPSLVDSISLFSARPGLSEVLALRTMLRDHPPDLAFILPYAGEGVFRLLAKLAFLRILGLRTAVFGAVMTGLPPRLHWLAYLTDALQHQARAPLRAISECPEVRGANLADTSYRVQIPPDDLCSANRLLASLNLKPRGFLALSLGATFAHKRWPVSRFVEVCVEINETFGLIPVCLGLQRDQELAHKFLLGYSRHAVDLTGKTTIPMLAAILKLAGLYLGNDGGSAHLAAAVGCPTVTIFSAIYYPGIWEPQGLDQEVLSFQVPCVNCQGITCCPLGTNECITGIPSAQVLRSCRSLLERQASRARAG